MEPRKRNPLSRIKVASVVIAVGCAIAVAGSGAAQAQPLQKGKMMPLPWFYCKPKR